MISSIRGTHDILPGEVERWQRLERVTRELCSCYGFQELRTPIIEREELFAKGTGQTTDIVQKEMYTFEDKGGERVTLRPEATPSMVRAFFQHALEQRLPAAKVFSLGPMFRYERPQKGRYRQFHQLDVEAFGESGASLDAEMIEMASSLVSSLGIESSDIVINSVGCESCRPQFNQALLDALGNKLDQLCPDCQRRAKTNPLRIYDCKVAADQCIIDELPHSVDHLCSDCNNHFCEVRTHLDAYELDYRVSHRLVRGLDYYMRTTFEVLGQQLGAQNALLGGGRYDGLVRQLGGPSREGIGFAAGLERLVLAMPEEVVGRGADVFIVALGENTKKQAHVLARDLRQHGLVTLIDYNVRSLRAQMKRADKTSARAAIILGDDELSRGEVTIKFMETGEQARIARTDIVQRLSQ